jgi:hypothetical protein
LNTLEEKNRHNNNKKALVRGDSDSTGSSDDEIEIDSDQNATSNNNAEKPSQNEVAGRPSSLNDANFPPLTNVSSEMTRLEKTQNGDTTNEDKQVNKNSAEMLAVLENIEKWCPD